MKLLGTPASPYARKVRIVLLEKKLPHDYVIARPSDPASGVGDANPLGKVPVLIRDDGRALYDSPVIVDYLEGLAPAPQLIPDAFADRIEVKRWEALADGIIDATVAVSHDARNPEGSRQAAEWHARQQRKIDAGLAAMERELGGRDACYGSSFSLADIACGVALGYLDHALPQVAWRERHPNLARHAARLFARPSFHDTRPA